MYGLAKAYANLDRHAEALPLQEECLALFKRVLPKDDPYIGACMYDLAFTYCYIGGHDNALVLFDKALVLLQQLLAFYKRILPKGDPEIDNVADWVGILQSHLV